MAQPNQPSPSSTSSPPPPPSANGATQQAARATAELLRWRADILMDEMMLGAADLSASDSERIPQPTNRFGEPSGQAETPRDFLPPPNPSRGNSFSNGQRPGSEPPAALSPNPTPQDSVSAARYESQRYESQLANYSTHPAPAYSAQEYPPRNYQPPSAPAPTDQPGGTGADAQLLPADRRYRATQGEVGSPYAASSLPNPTLAPPGPGSQPVPALGPVRVTPSARFANSMTVGPRANQYSTLLPRSSQMDLRATQLELATLTDQVEVKLPPGHDVHVRARHLLDKARDILSDNGDRGVEIEYYLQQVRAIVERAGQRVEASAIYRSRLVRYMLAWAALALVVIVGHLIYQPLIERALIERTTFAADGLVVRNVAALIITLASGVLGSAAGALANMSRHSRKQYGFFDRKYSTLGLMLPIIGLIVSLGIYLLCVPLFLLFGLNPLANRLLVIFPAALAFLFGYLQENLYGTNE